MNKTRSTFSWVLIITILCTIALLMNALSNKLKSSGERKEQLSSLPNLSLFTLHDSIRFDLKALLPEPIILIHFNSTCDHCQYEASSIHQSINRFRDSQLVFFSTESIKLIQNFSSKYKLNQYSNILFLKINPTDATKSLGKLHIPHIFIYNRSGKLVKEFKGEVKPESILKYIQ